MKTETFISIWMLAIVSAFTTSSVDAQFTKQTTVTGTALVPMSGRNIDYSYSTSQAIGSQAKLWMDVINPDPSQPIGVVVCAMLNFTATPMSGANFSIDDGGGTLWSATQFGSSSRSAFHLGCRRTNIPAGGAVNVFDDVIDMGRPITSVNSPYIDILKDLPLDSSVDSGSRATPLFPPIYGPDKFTGPTSSSLPGFNIWAAQVAMGGGGDASPAHVPTGNWVTMRRSIDEPTFFDARLSGQVSGVPIGSMITIDPNPEDEFESFEIVAESDVIELDVPFTIPPEEDAESSFTLVVPDNEPDGSFVRLDASVFSAESNDLYEDGQFMYDMDVLWIRDTISPDINEFSIAPNADGLVNVSVSAFDLTSGVAGAAFVFAVDDGPEERLAIPFAPVDPAVGVMSFEGSFDQFPLGASVTSYLQIADDIGNLTLTDTVTFVVPEPGAILMSIPTLVFLMFAIRTRSNRGQLARLDSR